MLFNFVQHYFISIVITVYMLIFLKTNNLLPKAITKQFTKATLIALTLIIVDNLELYTASLNHPTYWRILLSAIGYSLRPLVVFSILSFISKRESQKYVFERALLILNTLVVFSAFFTNLAYSYTASNEFVRGPLGYTPHIVCISLLIILFIDTMIHVSAKTIKDVLLVAAIDLVIILAIVLESAYQFEGIGTGGMVVSIMFYFVNYHSQNLKHDMLTGCYNYSSYKLDCEKLSAKIDGLIVIDMNNLKTLNDQYGHSEGDKALKTMAQTIQNVLPSFCNLYRIGGDEFAILCVDMWRVEITSLMNKIEEEMSKTEYSWSMGMAYKGESLVEMQKEADAKMYARKKKMKEQNLKNSSVNGKQM